MTVTIGNRLRVRSNSGSHNYPIGSVVTVVHTDSDGTFKCRRSDGTVGNWLRMRDCEPVGDTLWTVLQRDLPEDVVHFLSSFDGLDQLAVREDVAAEILTSLPDLLDRIVAEGRALKRDEAEQSAAGSSRKKPGSRAEPSAGATGAGAPTSSQHAAEEDTTGTAPQLDLDDPDVDDLFRSVSPDAGEGNASKEVA
jgi:hypothetical protein